MLDVSRTSPACISTRKNRLRAKEEQKRVLYVAMTRAREHLIISSGPSTKKTTGSFVAILDEALQDHITGAEQSTVVEIGPAKLDIQIVEASLTAPGRAKSQNPTTEKKRNWQPYVDTWAHRRSAYEAAIKTPVFVTPTLLKQQEQEMAESAEPNATGFIQSHAFHARWRISAPLS